MIWQGDVPRFLVIQYGARHGYAIPTAFHRTGALAGVYTDLTATHGAGAFLAGSSLGRGQFANALARRTPPAEISSAIHTSGVAFLAGQVIQLAIKGQRGTELGARLTKSLAERAMVMRGTCNATHVYTMLGEGGQFLTHAKKTSLAVICDVYIALSADRIVAREAERFPDWSDEPSNPAGIAERESLGRSLLSRADLLVCPSEFVRNDLVNYYDVEISRTLVAPYAASPQWLSLNTSPEPGRILFAGTASLRKGIHYLAVAAQHLGKRYKIRVAGSASPKVRAHRDASQLTFLGHLSSLQMADEYALADALVLPSLAEGSASVTAEALGAGLPVITTHAAGSIVRDGIDGIIVPERDPEALACAIRSIVEDRDKRAAMSRAARERAQEFTWDRFADAVVKAARSVHPQNEY